MTKGRLRRRRIPRRGTGFGLVDALVGLSLLAVTLLGACGSLHFALRATRSAAWQARAVDLVADLNEDLQHDDPALPLTDRLESWRQRLRQDLPSGEISAMDPRNLVAGATGINWFDLRLAWNGTPGGPRETLELPVAQEPVR
jgi:hypothetical protein